MHPIFIKNDRHVSLYMMDVAMLRINVIANFPTEPTTSFNKNDSVENENLDDQPDERFCDQSNENLGDDSMKGHDRSLDVEDQPVDAEDFEHFEEDEAELKLR